MMAPLTLFWSRNAYFEQHNEKSYIYYFKSYPIASSTEELHALIANYNNIQVTLMKSLKKSPLDTYDFHDYLELMLGNACNYINCDTTNINCVENCQDSVVAYGLQTALLGYLNEVRLLSSSQGAEIDHDHLNYIEKYNKDIENGFVQGLVLFTKKTGSISNSVKQMISVATCLACLFIVTVYILFGHNLAHDILKDFKAKIIVSTVFLGKKKKLSKAK